VLALLYKGFLPFFCLIDRVLGQHLKVRVLDEDSSFEEPILQLSILNVFGGDHIKSSKEVLVASVLCTSNDQKERPLAAIMNYSFGWVDQVQKYYAVRKGNVIGIYHSWDECSILVTSFKAAKFKSFKSLRDAKTFLHFGSSL
jgi:hypothetical protein